MIALIQRVRGAHVDVDNLRVGEIGHGLLVLVCAEPHDDKATADRLVDKLLKLRVFADDAGKMNRSVQDVQGGLLIIPQFTLAADTKSGMRPGFSTAASPEEGRRLFERFVLLALQKQVHVKTGEFGADMKVSLVNDGPVTFWLQTSAPP